MSNAIFREALLASTIIAGMSFVATPAFAQADQPQPAPAGQPAAQPAEEGPAIVVTGTLIRNPNLLASAPVAVVGQDELQLRQTNTAEEVLRDLPGAVASIGNAVNNGNGGSSFADLRGLGNFRNLILLDGQRIVPSSDVGRVDLNNIPLALVERVDTLTGGAAVTYGADAVSGVVNFITRRDFAGVEITASEQITEQGDGNVFRGDATIGANFDDGRGNVVLSLGYQQADAVYQGARAFSRNTYTSTTGHSGGSGTTVPGRFTLGGTFNQVNPTTGALQRPVVNFNFNPYNIFQTPFQRFNIYGAGHYDVADNIEFYTRGMFSKNTVNTIVAPSGLFSNVALIPVSNPFLPAAARAQFCANNDFDPVTPGILTLTPAQCAAAAAATNPADPNFRAFTTTIGRRFIEAGPRESSFITQMFDYRAGLRIGITRSINLDISGSYGESENRETQSNYILLSRARTALFTTSATSCNLGSSPSVPNPNPALPPIANAGASPTAGTGCVPLNIFGGPGSITPAMISYLTAHATDAQQTSLAQARALLNGDFGASSPWAEDPIGFAVGGEYRRYRATQSADALRSTSGELGGAGAAVLNYNGGYKVYEAYGELIAPLVQHRPGFENLTLEAGIRYSGYTVEAPTSPSYNTTTWKLAGTWEPMRGIRFRGNFQRAVRAPNISELFQPTIIGLTNVATDPCRGALPVNNANLRAVCIAQGAPASTIGSIVNPTAAQANGTFSGALYLRPEISDSYTVGTVLQPAFIPGLSITVDYYHILITHAISQPTPQDVINACFGDNNGSGITAASVTNPACALFHRNAVTGGLDGDPATVGGLVFVVSNSGRIFTDGVDFALNYRRDLGFAKLNLGFNGNWTHRSLFQATAPGSVIPPGYPGAGTPVPATATRECVGLYSPNCGSPGSAGPSGTGANSGTTPGSLQPKFIWLQRTTLTFGEIDVSLMWRHISSMNAEPGTLGQVFSGTITSGALAGQTFNFGHIPSYNYFDLAMRFSLNEHLDLTFTVQNLLNKLPPIVGSTIGSTTFNSGNTYPSTYDALGRRYAASVRLRF